MLPFIIFSIFFFLLLMIIITCQDDKIATLTAQNGLMRNRLIAHQFDEEPEDGCSEVDNAPLTAAGIEAAVRNAGYNPDTSEEWVRFMVAEERFIIETSRLPKIFISRYYNVQTSDWDMDLLKKAAHLMSDDLIMVKAVFDEQPGGTTLRFFVAAMDRNYQSFRNNLTSYLSIVDNGVTRMHEIYEELIEDKNNPNKLMAHSPAINKNDPKLLS